MAGETGKNNFQHLQNMERAFAVSSLNDIDAKIREEQQTLLIVIVFAQPNNSLVKEQLLPAMDHLHHSSGKLVQFFYCGYEEIDAPSQNQSNTHSVYKVGSKWWDFDPEVFADMKKNAEEEFNWEYSGGMDLIAATVNRNKLGKTCIRFSEALVCRMNSLIDEKKIENLNRFFEELISFGKPTQSTSGYDLRDWLLDKCGLKASEDFAGDTSIFIENILRN